MLLSSGVIWRHRDFERFRADCPAGDPALQRTVFDRLDADLAWLESLGARPLAARDRQPAHRGRAVRHAPADRRAAARGGRRGAAAASRSPKLPGGVPVVLATGGFQADRDLVARPRDPRGGRADAARDARGARATGCASGSRRAARSRPAWTSSTGATCPRRPRGSGRSDFVRLAQLYATHATVRNAPRRARTTPTHVVGDRRRPVDRPPARRAGLVRGRRRRSRAPGARSHGRRR